MKMSTNFANPKYNSETCDSFTLILTSDSISLFETTHSWADPSGSDHSLFVQITSGYISVSALTSSLNSLVLTHGFYSTSYACTVTIVASSAVNQNYDLGTLAGATSY
jgi:hypothetical protein